MVQRAMNSRWARYRLEWIIIGVAGIGFLLLTMEPDGLWAYGTELVTGLGTGLTAPARQGSAWLGAHLGDVDWDEQVGALLLVGAVGFLALRLRRHTIQRARATLHACPRCGGPVARIHRTQLDRLLGVILFLPLARYLCHNPTCRWQGLQIGSTRRRRQARRNP